MMFAAWVAPACFIFRHVFCFASFLLLACLRMSCCGMFYGRSGMFYFPTCSLLRFVCSAGLFAHVLFRHFLWSLRQVVFTDMFSACVSSGMFLLSACFGMFDFLACLSTFFCRLVSFPFTFAARYLSSSLWLLRKAGPCNMFTYLRRRHALCSGMFLLSASFGMFDFSTHNCGQVLVLLVVATTGRAKLRLSNAVQRRHDMTMACSFLHADCYHVVLFWSLWLN
jgi:hypothetical protein